MRRNIFIRSTVVIFLSVFICLTYSCEDQREVTFTANVPVYLSYEDFRIPVVVENSRELKKPGKIYFKDNFIYINEINKGIHIINNSDPSNPQNLKFIPIQGNFDIAIRDNYLYADSYIDLLVFDISDLNNIREEKRIKNLFDYTLPPSNPDYPVDQIDDKKGIVTGWEIKKITREETGNIYPYPNGPMSWMGFDKYYSSEASWISNPRGTVNASASGTGGSMARFIVYNNYLYMISSYNIKIFSLIDAKNPSIAGTIYGGWGLETVFIADDYMYIGSQTGMEIYSLDNPFNPQKTGSYSHVTTCDPVVVEGNYAYVTLRSGTWCGDTINRLDVVDISNKVNPLRIRSYTMVNPHGLGIENSILFICDGTAGLKIYDASDINTITSHLISQFPDINAFDVIPMNGIMFLIGDDGLFQYDYSNLSNINQLSVIPVN
jgi:hypothetical protein